MKTKKNIDYIRSLECDALAELLVSCSDEAVDDGDFSYEEEWIPFWRTITNYITPTGERYECRDDAVKATVQWLKSDFQPIEPKPIEGQLSLFDFDED